MSANLWTYRHCLRCGQQIPAAFQEAGRVWCDECDRTADDELMAMGGAGDE